MSSCTCLVCLISILLSVSYLCSLVTEQGHKGYLFNRPEQSSRGEILTNSIERPDHYLFFLLISTSHREPFRLSIMLC